MSLCLPWSPPLYQSCVALLVTAIISTLCPLSLCQPSRLTCVPGLGTRRHAYLVSPVLMTAIMSVFCPQSSCPQLRLPCVSVLVPAIMSTLCPRLGARHHISLELFYLSYYVYLVSVLVPANMSTLCFCLSARHHVYLVSPS